MKRKFSTTIKDGRIEMQTSQQIGAYLKGRKDGVCVIEVLTGVDVEERLRSSPQNRYYWGVVLPEYLRAMAEVGDTTAEDVRKELRCDTLIDAVHELLKYEFAGCEVIDYNTGAVYTLPMTTTKMTTVEMGAYWSKIVEACRERYGYDIPPPPDDLFV